MYSFFAVITGPDDDYEVQGIVRYESDGRPMVEHLKTNGNYLDARIVPCTTERAIDELIFEVEVE